MSEPSLLLLAADAILIVHVFFVAFVVLGLVVIYLGWLLAWPWVRHRLFRIAHLAAIGFVVIQVWLGAICPLTLWEAALRTEAGAESYSGSFIQHWLHRLLFYSAPDWVFVLLYTSFGGLVLLSWYLVRPDASGDRDGN